jgi:hypothetical protein
MKAALLAIGGLVLAWLLGAFLRGVLGESWKWTKALLPRSVFWKPADVTPEQLYREQFYDKLPAEVKDVLKERR